MGPGHPKINSFFRRFERPITISRIRVGPVLSTPIGARGGQSQPRSGRNTCITETCAFCMTFRVVVRALATAVERLVEGHDHDRFFSPSSIDHQRRPQRCALPPNIAHAPRRISP